MRRMYDGAMVDLPPAAPAAEPRRHHYVPRFLLKHFATERRPGRFQIRAFDKQAGRSITTAVENVVVESDFNTLEADGVRVSLEAGMGVVESEVAGPINRIVTDGTLAGLTVATRAAVDFFCALQLLRGTGLRNQFAHLAEAMRDRMAAAGSGAAAGPALDADALKAAAFAIIHDGLADFAGRFGEKDLVLVEANGAGEFMIGDNPIAMQNERDFGPYGNLGLSVPGIEIYMPISSRYCLGFWCPSILQRFRDAMAQAEDIIARANSLLVVGAPDIARQQPRIIAQATASLGRVRTMPDAFEAGGPVSWTGNVERLNSLQIRTAERWVMCRDGDFELVERMIADNAQNRGGLRARIN